MGKKLVHQRILILNELETVKEFKAFGKTKNGKWKGIGVHDDIAMSAVNIAHLYDEGEYEDWLYDFLEEMESNNIKFKINELLEKYTENTDISDDNFTSLFEDNTQSENLNIYPSINPPKYTPSYTFGKSNLSYPWRNS
jgi:hypothetical protein